MVNEISSIGSCNENLFKINEEREQEEKIITKKVLNSINKLISLTNKV